jgi:hypothetical protein
MEHVLVFICLYCHNETVQALIPPDSKSNYDLHMEYSMRDLKSYRQNVTVDIIYIYPDEHIPLSTSEIQKKVDPRKIQDDLTSTMRNDIAVVECHRRWYLLTKFRTWLKSLDT